MNAIVSFSCRFSGRYTLTRGFTFDRDSIELLSPPPLPCVLHILTFLSHIRAPRVPLARERCHLWHRDLSPVSHERLESLFQTFVRTHTEKADLHCVLQRASERPSENGSGTHATLLPSSPTALSIYPCLLYRHDSRLPRRRLPLLPAVRQAHFVFRSNVTCVCRRKNVKIRSRQAGCGIFRRTLSSAFASPGSDCYLGREIGCKLFEKYRSRVDDLASIIYQKLTLEYWHIAVKIMKIIKRHVNVETYYQPQLETCFT